MSRVMDSVPSYVLEVLEGIDKGRRIPVNGSDLMLGRNTTPGKKAAEMAEPFRSILFDEPSVSRHHAGLKWDDSRKCYMIVHRSHTNSTQVNGQPVEKVALREGDIVTLGLLVFKYTVDPHGKPSVTEPPPPAASGAGTSSMTKPPPPAASGAGTSGMTKPPPPAAMTKPPKSAGPGESVLDRIKKSQTSQTSSPNESIPGTAKKSSVPEIQQDTGHLETVSVSDRKPEKPAVTQTLAFKERPGKKKRFEFTAVTRTGENLTGLLDADDELEVVNELNDRRLKVINVKILRVNPQPKKRKISLKEAPEAESVFFRFKKRYERLINKLHPVSDKTLFVFTHQLATMLGAGIHVTSGINSILKAETDKRFSQILRGLVNSFEGGLSAYSAFSKYPDVFSKAYRGIIAIGESSGQLPYILDRQAKDLEKLYTFKRKVSASMTYPMVILVFSIISVLFMMLYFVPNFMGIYKETQAQLPMITTLLLATVNCLSSARFWIIVIIAGMLIYFLLSNYLSTPIGKHNFDSILLKLPIFGKLVASNNLYALFMNLALMLECGLQIRESLTIIRDMTDNAVIGDSLEQVVNSIEHGESLYDSLRDLWFVPRFVIDLVQAGESSGELPIMIRKSAQIMEDQVNDLLDTFLNVLEPVMIGVLACVVGGIMVAIFLPISNIVNTFSG